MTSTSPLTSVGGLISGLDTNSIITQLMQIEAEPQTALKTTLTNTQSAITSYQDLNTKFQALLTAAQNLTNPSTWGARTATSSDSSVAASATASALTGSVTFTVNQLATAQSLISTTLDVVADRHLDLQPHRRIVLDRRRRRHLDHDHAGRRLAAVGGLGGQHLRGRGPGRRRTGRAGPVPPAAHQRPAPARPRPSPSTGWTGWAVRRSSRTRRTRASTSGPPPRAST